jgi:hypothetical protein
VTIFSSLLAIRTLKRAVSELQVSVFVQVVDPKTLLGDMHEKVPLLAPRRRRGFRVSYLNLPRRSKTSIL